MSDSGNYNYPLSLQKGFHDICIIGPDQDRAHMSKLAKILGTFVKLSDGTCIEVGTIEINRVHVSKIERLEQLLQRSTYYFVYISEHFENDSWFQFVKSEALESTIEKDRWCAVPVYSQPQHRQQFQVFGLQGVKGLCVTSLFKGKDIGAVNLETLSETDLNRQLVDALSKMVQRRQYEKKKKESDLHQQRKIFREKEKLKLLRKLKGTELPQESEYEDMIMCSGPAGFDMSRVNGGHQVQTTQVSPLMCAPPTCYTRNGNTTPDITHNTTQQMHIDDEPEILNLTETDDSGDFEEDDDGWVHLVPPPSGPEEMNMPTISDSDCDDEEDRPRLTKSDGDKRHNKFNRNNSK